MMPMSPFSQEVFRTITDFGDDAVTGSLAVALTLCLFLTKHRKAALMVASAFVVTVGILAVAKMALYSRCEPSQVFYDLRSPSGHSALAIVVYGLFAALVSASLSGWRRAVPFLVVGPLVFLVSVSRIILGAHTGGDVVVGSAVGIAISVGAWRIFMRKESINADWKTLLAVVLVVLAVMYGLHFSAEGILAMIARYFRTRVLC